ncbi:MAG: hypothetical protein JST70_15700 [Bacteroidetes bacterium]|nr:hypothetical protein [Bacteroidota bacterium]
MIVSFEYRDLFDDELPDINALLANVPSRFIIGILATINDTLDIRKDTPDTQWFLLIHLTVNFQEAERARILRLSQPLILQGRKLFAHRFTVDLISKELLHFKGDDVQIEENFAEDEYNLFKAYLANIHLLNLRDIEDMGPEIRNAADQGGDHLLRLMWPHLYKQYQFNNRPDAIKETCRGLALMTYIENHPVFGNFARAYYPTLGCNSPQEYIHRLLGLAVPNLQRVPSDNPMDYFFRIRIDQSEPVLDSLVINPQAVQENEELQLDYRALKEKPLFQFDEGEFIVPYWDYLYNALNLGILFSFYNDSGVNASVTDFGRFKGTIGKEFSENILFKNMMISCFSNKYDSLLFFDDNNSFNPDCYYRTGNNIFLIEFKDYLLNAEVIQSGSYEVIEQAIKEKFVELEVEEGWRTRIKPKGVSQIANNLNYLVGNQDRFWQIDEKAARQRLKLRNMVIHPIIIQTNIYFDFPALNEYLDGTFQPRVNNIRNSFRSIKPVTMIHFDYFFDKIVLFAKGNLKLSNEIDHYHTEMLRRKKRAQRTLNENDWFQSYAPFSYVQSPDASKYFYHRRDEILAAIKQCWNIP